MEERYISCMVMHAVGDTVGFKNGDWEFKSGTDERKILEKLFEFIGLGGVNKIQLKGWTVSDDTIMHMKTAESLIDSKDDNIDTILSTMKKHFIPTYKQLKKDANKRRPGLSTMINLYKLNKGYEINKLEYDYYQGGSGASMRSLCIGLAFHDNIDKLIEVAIESSRITNNSAIGYLGGLASALFASYAVNNIPIKEWIHKLLALHESGKITDYIKKTERDVDKYYSHGNLFFEKMYIYKDEKFDDNGDVIKKRVHTDLLYRNRHYNDVYGFKPLRKLDNTSRPSSFIGSGGDDSVIIAYDSLLDAGSNWEQLIVYSMLHMGDTDTTGAIAAGLYGLLYGTKYITNNYLEHLEYKKELESIGKNLYKKFYKK